MDHPGIHYALRWRHVVISTHRSWNPGDERGWRSRGHKRHSSGDYKQRPPEQEHRGLRRWVDRQGGDTIVLPAELRGPIGHSLLEQLRADAWSPIVCAVADKHAHVLVQLPDHPPTMRKIIGDAKRVSSKSIRGQMPGKVWAAGAKFEPVDDASHHRNAYAYIRDKQGPKAWVWTVDEGVVQVPCDLP